MRKFGSGVVVAAALLMAGCNFHATLPESNPELNAQADRLYRDLAAGREEAVVGVMSRETTPAATRVQLPMIRKLTGTETPPTPKVTGTQRLRSTDGDFYSVWQDYEYPNRVAHMATRFKDQDGEWKVFGFNVNVEMKPGVAAAEDATTAIAPTSSPPAA